MRARMLAVFRHPISQNVLAVGGVQVVLTILPLVTLPYLARVLSKTELGLVVFTQTYSFIVALVVEYGFNLSATREVAQVRDDPKALARTVIDTQAARVFLSVVATVLSVPLFWVVPVFHDEPTLLVYGVALGILTGYFPIYFFLGLERPRAMAVVQLVSRLISVALIVLLVRDEGQGELVLVIYVVTAAVNVAYGTFAIRRTLTERWRPRPEDVRATLRRARTLFFGTGAIAVYTGSNGFLIGLVLKPEAVALFSAAEKIIRAGCRVLTLMGNAVYPRISVLVARGDHARANQLSWLSLVVFVVVASVSGLALAAGAHPLIRVLYGPGFGESAGLLQVLCLILPLNILATSLSTQFLLPQGRDRIVSSAVVAAAVINVVLVLVAAKVIGLDGVPPAIAIAEALVSLIYVAVLRRGGQPAPANA